MVFSSLTFLFIFLPLALIIYHISPKAFKNFILMVLSLFFYALGEPIYILIMIFSIVFDYTNGRLIDKFFDKPNYKKAVFLTSLIVNIGILSFFKYSHFMIGNINSLINTHINCTNLPLPLGISFYTFQSISYVTDVYLGKVKAQKNIINYGTYVTMFPQLIAGPIVKYSHIETYLTKKDICLDSFNNGCELFLRGLFKKVLLANNIGMLWSTIKNTPNSSAAVLTAWIGIIAFTFQIYFDFSGYSDMACGLAKMFGFKLVDNFNYPYMSKSITEYWRRWHISLGSWFREYVYIPLGGNRCRKVIQYRNILIVWMLTGLWHGASWNFVLWGLYFGFFVTIEKIYVLQLLSKLPNIFKHLYTMLIVIVGWVIFEFESLSQCFNFLSNMFFLKGNAFINTDTLYYLKSYGIMLLACCIFSTPLFSNILLKLQNKYNKLCAAVTSMLYITILIAATAYLVNETYNPFLYFRF